MDNDGERFHDALAQVRALNKTDINSLAQTFGSFANICSASADSLALIPGLGPKKVSRLLEAFRQPFKPVRTTLPNNVVMNPPLVVPPPPQHDVDANVDADADTNTNVNL